MPIPVYTQDAAPTSAAKADGITPKTAAALSNASVTASAPNPATTTAIPHNTSPPHPQAQPGAHIIPAPTNAYGESTGPASNYTPLPLNPTPTHTTQSDGPPAPQPGAVPVPPGGGARCNLPPPPKVGEKYVPPAPVKAPQPAAHRTMPPQFGYAPPNSTYQPATMSTVPSTVSSQSYPAALPYNSPVVGGNDDRLEHPPGYHQNLYAANQTPQQRAASQLQSAQDASYHRAGTMNDGLEEDSIWDTAKSWAFSAGKKMAETEAEIWKRINGEK